MLELSMRNAGTEGGGVVEKSLSHMQMKHACTEQVLDGLLLRGTDTVRIVPEAVKEMTEPHAVAKQGRAHAILKAGVWSGEQRTPRVPAVLLHAFASYQRFTHRNFPALQTQFGHRGSPQLHTRYLNLNSRRQTDAWLFRRLSGA